MSSLWKQQPLVMETKNTAEQLQRTHGDATGVRPHQYIKENITDTRFQIFTLIIVNRCIKIRYYHHNYSVLFIVLVHVFRIQARFELSLPTIQLRSSPPPPIEKSQTLYCAGYWQIVAKLEWRPPPNILHSLHLLDNFILIPAIDSSREC